MRRPTAHEELGRNERNEGPWREKTQRRQADAEAAHRNGRGAPELQPWPQQAGRGREGQTPFDRRRARTQGRAGAGRSAEETRGRGRPQAGRRGAGAVRGAEILRRRAAHADQGRNGRARACAGRQPRARGRRAQDRRGRGAPPSLARKRRPQRTRSRRGAQARRGRAPQARGGIQAQGRRSRQEAPGRRRNQAPGRSAARAWRSKPTRRRRRARAVRAALRVRQPHVPRRRAAAPAKQRGRLTLVTALRADEVRERSVASFRRRTQRLKGHASNEPKEKLVREVTIPDAITIRISPIACRSARSTSSAC